MAPIDYSKGQIYTLRSKSRPDLIYVGSTCNPLHKRMNQHRSNFKAWQEGKRHYITSCEIFKIGDAYIEWFEDFPTDSKKKSEKREGEVMRSFNDCVNKRKNTGKTTKERRDEQDKAAVKEYNRQYREAHREHLQEVTRKYRETHKDILNQKQREKWHANKEVLLAKDYQKIICECGATTSRCNKFRHCKTAKHIEWFIWY